MELQVMVNEAQQSSKLAKSRSHKVENYLTCQWERSQR